MTVAPVELPPKLIPVFLGPARYRGAYGGRGSAKTRSFAKMTAIRAYQAAEAGQSGAILCAREYMNSLEDSSLEEVKEAIRSEPWLEDYFEVGEKFIRTRNGLVRYIFTGLRNNLDSIKSKANILIAWVDEAEAVSEAGWRKLIPTVRGENSEIWVTWNPELDGSPTDERFRKHEPTGSKFVEINYQDNPWFPDVLEQERKDDLERLDLATYAHIWEGQYLENSDAQILHGKVAVREFEPEKSWDGPYYGGDFGFSQDPTAAVEVWIHDQTLYVRREAVKVGLEIDDTQSFVEAKIPGFSKSVSRWDSARPESISYLKRHGMAGAKSVTKWSGSVEDGIAHLRGYKEIVIHPQCTEAQREARLYSYKVDRLSGDVTTKIVDAHNHVIDAIRYAIAPMIKSGSRAGVLVKSRHR